VSNQIVKPTPSKIVSSSKSKSPLNEPDSSNVIPSPKLNSPNETESPKSPRLKSSVNETDSPKSPRLKSSNETDSPKPPKVKSSKGDHHHSPKNRQDQSPSYPKAKAIVSHLTPRSDKELIYKIGDEVEVIKN